MRNPNRLYDFYRELQAIHVAKYPDIRFGQLVTNILTWISNEKKTNPFFVEDDKMFEYIREFAGINT